MPCSRSPEGQEFLRRASAAATGPSLGFTCSARVQGPSSLHLPYPHPSFSPSCPPQVVVQALRHETALNKSFDIVAKEEGEGQPTWEWESLFDETSAGL